jgi:hypothetical protein
LGVEDQVDLTAVALCALGLTGYVCFWIYLFSHTAGVTFSYASLLTLNRFFRNSFQDSLLEARVGFRLRALCRFCKLWKSRWGRP